jgi:hypothetical protein
MFDPFNALRFLGYLLTNKKLFESVPYLKRPVQIRLLIDSEQLREPELFTHELYALSIKNDG